MKNFKRKKISLGLCILLLGTHTTRIHPISDSYKAVASFFISCGGTFALSFLVMKIFNYLQARSLGISFDSVKSVPKQLDGNLKNNYGTCELPDEVICLIDQLKNPEYYKKLKAPVVKSMLLYGPPGTGKTSLARCIAAEVECDFFAVNSTDFSSPLRGIASQKVKDLFSSAISWASKSKTKCAIIFIDEIDGLGNKNSVTVNADSAHDILNTLLTSMDGFKKLNDVAIVVIAATNVKGNVDKALLSRFTPNVIEIPMPDERTRGAIAGIYIGKWGQSLDSRITAQKIAQLTSGMAGRTIEKLFDEAARRAGLLRKSQIKLDDFAYVLANFRENNGATNDEKDRIAQEYVNSMYFLPFDKNFFIERSNGMSSDQFRCIFNNAYRSKAFKGNTEKVDPNDLIRSMVNEQAKLKKESLCKIFTVYTTLYSCDRDIKPEALIKQFKDITKDNISTVFKSAHKNAKRENRNINVKDLLLIQQ